MFCLCVCVSCAAENSIAPLLREHHIRRCFVYDALGARDDLHLTGSIHTPDCTHFNLEAVAFMNEEVLRVATAEGGWS